MTDSVFADQTHIASATFTRPTNTTTYATGDAMGTGAAGCVLQFTVPYPRGVIKSARLWKSSTGTTADDFRLLLFRKTPTNSPNENAAPSTSFIDIADKDKFVGMIDFETAVALAAGNYYEGQDYVPSTGIPFVVQSHTLFGILTAIANYDPASGEIFTINLEVSQ